MITPSRIAIAVGAVGVFIVVVGHAMEDYAKASIWAVAWVVILVAWFVVTRPRRRPDDPDDVDDRDEE